ncbi:pantetheine-phosphate adenylyltransferase [Egicoccus sp. AB-alg6-2]|uniref:pantetheine-phosphate adenylyltransferase n=1 Tax=Egicoccus sp. AB-alg6-2 TaxID=3242692 RepID=UPI00359DE390
MTVSVVVPGSFDPVTLGHLDIVRRACARFDRVVVAVLENPNKQGLFSVDERLELIRAVAGDVPNLEVDRFEGLLVDFCNARGIGIICKGLRAVSDFEYELQMAQMNHRIGGVETVFMSTSPEHSYLSSSLVKEVARFGGPLDGTVPPAVADALRERLG